MTNNKGIGRKVIGSDSPIMGMPCEQAREIMSREISADTLRATVHIALCSNCRKDLLGRKKGAAK